MPFRLRPGDRATAGCLLERSPTPGGKIPVLHGPEPGGRVRSSEGAELSGSRRRARGPGRGHRGAPVGRAIVLRRGPVGKSSLFRGRGHGISGVDGEFKSSLVRQDRYSTAENSSRYFANPE